MATASVGGRRHAWPDVHQLPRASSCGYGLVPCFLTFLSSPLLPVLFLVASRLALRRADAWLLSCVLCLPWLFYDVRTGAPRSLFYFSCLRRCLSSSSKCEYRLQRGRISRACTCALSLLSWLRLLLRMRLASVSDFRVYGWCAVVCGFTSVSVLVRVRACGSRPSCVRLGPPCRALLPLA